ncbi:MAG: hypothetical protein HYY14_04145 [Candidatus Omnitrophica bacterium]|nr:hypothetical protein [Candidatus Omnitrophota bacterium]
MLDGSRTNRILLIVILALILADFLKTQSCSNEAWAQNLLSPHLSLAVEGGAFFILSPEDKMIYAYDRRQGKLGRIYHITELAQDFTIKTGGWKSN